jgi:ubiquinone/menaquinone biosynthesis C-methylase UbiE
MNTSIEEQKNEFEIIYNHENLTQFSFNFTDDKLTRYVRDRRLNIGLSYLRSKYQKNELENWKVLILCGGVGGEAVFFMNKGFKDVTLSDFSQNSLAMANILAPQLKTILLNAEALELKPGDYDLIVVQDGLHHLPRPALGLTEMLRVAKKAVMVIEPYESLIGNAIGTKWEVHGNAINWVYRWNRKMVEQTVKSYLLRDYDSIKVFRLLDHTLTINRIAKIFPRHISVLVAKTIYYLLSIFNFWGNMMVAIVTKQ